MIELKEAQTDIRTAIKAIVGEKAFTEIEITNGKITLLRYDDSKLTASEKKQLESIANNTNANLVKEVK